MPDTPNPRSSLPGWGADLDPAQRPAYPRERQPPRLPAHAQRQPAQQAQTVEVLHSTERPGRTPVFGSAQPPRGLSGSLRRYAFGFSENDMRHWLLLLLADRIDVVEGLAEDLSHGHVPNLWAEMGWATEWRHNRPALVRRMGTAAALGVLAWLLWRGRRLGPPDRLMRPRGR